jgi:hypothetical protein
MESLESSSPIVTRAVAAGLQGRYCDIYELPAWQKTALHALGALPQGVGRWVISRFQTLSGLPPERVVGLSMETRAEWRLRDYAGLPGRFPAITVGAALGGATAHLSLALGGPFLPQAFVVTLRGGSPTGDVTAYFRRSAALAREIAAANPNVMTIQHFDPVHDGWLTRWVNHLRFKLLGLPQAYADFIRQRLAPGGAVCFLDCGAAWLRYRVGERSVFQVGGWGDISPEEFLEASRSDRIRRVGRGEGLTHFDWRLPDHPLERGPESEWGTEPGLGEALEDFCGREGYRFVRIHLPEPHDFSRLAFRATAHLLEKEGRAPAGALIEIFSQFDATAVLRAGLLPLWLVFNTRDSLEFMRRMLPQFPAGKPIFFSPLSTFSLTPDLVPWADWEAALQGLPWTNVGVRPSHYPADVRALVTWTDKLRAWCEKNAQPIRERLSAEALKELSTDATDKRLGRVNGYSG